MVLARVEQPGPDLSPADQDRMRRRMSTTTRMHRLSSTNHLFSSPGLALSRSSSLTLTSVTAQCPPLHLLSFRGSTPLVPPPIRSGGSPSLPSSSTPIPPTNYIPSFVTSLHPFLETGKVIISSCCRKINWQVQIIFYY